MDDDAPRPKKEYPLSTAKMSKTPSWVMVGFVLGAVTAWSISGQLRKERAGAAARKPEPVATTVRYVPQSVETIDAVFAEWAAHAEKLGAWEHDTTEVALWNKETSGFTDCFEVKRYAGRHYFRPIPELTRRVIRHGKEIPECPLLFTESEEQYQEWKQHGRSERPVGDYRPVSAFPAAGAGAETKAGVLPRPEIAPLPPPKFEAIAPFDPAATAKEKK